MPTPVEVQSALLKHLEAHGPATAGQLAQALHLSVAVITSNLGVLGRAGRVQKLSSSGSGMSIYGVGTITTSSPIPTTPTQPNKPRSYNDRFWQAFLRGKEPPME